MFCYLGNFVKTTAPCGWKRVSKSELEQTLLQFALAWNLRCEVLETAVNLWASEIKTWELLVTAYRAVGDAAGTQRALERVRALR